MLLEISIVMTILGVLFNKSKGVFCVIIFWEWILLGFCSDTTRFDYANYVISYESAGSSVFSDYSGTEPGFFLLCKFLQLIGLSSFHDAYKIMVAFIIFSVAYVIWRNTKRVCLPMVLFLWYPAIMSAYNTREGIAMGIMLIAIQVLLDDKKYCLFKYIVLTLIAASIHTSAFFYLIFIVLKLWKQLSKKYIAIIVAIGIVLMLGIDNVPIIQSLLGNGRFYYYFGRKHVSNITAIISIVWQLSICMLIFILKHVKSSSCAYVDIQRLCGQKYYDYVEKIFWLLLILCPMYFYTFTYIRLTRNLLVFFYIYYAKWVDFPNIGLRVFKYTAFPLWSVATIYGFNVIVSSDFEEVIQVFYGYNNFSQNIFDYIFVIMFFVMFISWGFLMDILKHKKSVRILTA